VCGLASLLVTHCGSERARFERKPRLCHLSTLLPAAPDAHEVQRARQALRSELGETQGRVQRTAPSPQGAPPPGHYAHPAVGAQDAVSTGGPALALLGFLVLPLVWSVPEALVTAELATAFPEDSGYVAWVTAAFGPFWGFQEGWWSWLSGVTDNSVYPVLLLSYVDAVLPGARAPARAAPARRALCQGVAPPPLSQPVCIADCRFTNARQSTMPRSALQSRRRLTQQWLPCRFKPERPCCPAHSRACAAPGTVFGDPRGVHMVVLHCTDLSCDLRLFAAHAALAAMPLVCYCCHAAAPALTCAARARAPGLLPEGTWRRFFTLFAVALGLACLNYFGLTIVGGVAVGMTAFIVAVFVVLCGFAAPHVQPANWLILDWGAVQWGAFLNVMFWNTNYWDSCRRAPLWQGRCRRQIGSG